MYGMYLPEPGMSNPDGEVFDEQQEDQSEILEEGLDPEQLAALRQKHKRRSKNDLKGRDFQCGCGKRYLSYPALYTHIKTKHNGQNPKGTNAPQYQSGRGRGRPRKSNIAIAPINTAPAANSLDPTGRAGTSALNAQAASKPEEQKKIIEVYNGDEVLKRFGALEGDKCEPSSSFESFLRLVRTDKVSEYLWLQKVLKAVAEAEMEEKQREDMPVSTGIKKTCDKVLGEYLWDLGKKVNEKFFHIMIIFVNAYKQCMDEYGWEILRKYRQVSFEERKKEFVVSNDAEHMPEVSNDFISYFLPKEHPCFEKNLAIELTRHFCEWLKKNKHTHACLALI